MNGSGRVIPLRAPRQDREGDLIECCEASFNIDIDPDEAEACRTLGDLYDVIRWKCHSDRLAPSATAIARSYRDLRQHLCAAGLSRAVRPTTRLDGLLGPDPRPVWSRLKTRLGKALPPLELSDGQNALMSVFIALGLSAGIFGGEWIADLTDNPALGVLVGIVALLLTIAAVFAFAHRFARSMPRGLETLADLARAAALHAPARGEARNPSQPAALWEALEDIIRREGGFEGPITPDLRVEASRMREDPARRG